MILCAILSKVIFMCYMSLSVVYMLCVGNIYVSCHMSLSDVFMLHKNA